MKISVIIQARMGSRRFPGKSLHIIKGKPVLGHVVDSVAQTFKRSLIHVATSASIESKAIEEYCTSNSINVYLGDEERVASRFYDIVKKTNVDYFVRISGDSPLLDYRVIETALNRLHREPEPPDMITTVSEQPYPSGSNVEIIKTSTFLNSYPLFYTVEHFEHVTRYFYQNKSKFNICYLDSGIENSSSYKFSFDTAEDLQKIEEIFGQMHREHYTYTLEEKCAMYDKVTSISQK